MENPSEKPKKAKSPKATGSSRASQPEQVQLGWGDWSDTIQPPKAPVKSETPKSEAEVFAETAPMSSVKPKKWTSGAKSTSEKPAPEKSTSRDWSKLEFPKTQTLEKAGVETSTAVEKSEEISTESSNGSSSGPSGDSLSESREAVAVSAEPVVLTVGQLNKMIRRQLETEFASLWLKGEISNFKAHPSGHFYFSLKDKDAQVSAVMFRGYNSQLRFRPEDGMEVVIRGKITVYEPRGNYQVMCESMEPVGAGALQKAFEQLKRKLEGEGLFDQARKRPIPAVPKHIAIVTSPSGAAIRDMLNVLSRRYKAARITLVPATVQGARAAGEIVKAIQLANQLSDVDVLIVGRGGGSIEDMWCFNEEVVARAIVASRVPVISAVGHEIDFTIADFVADLRAPTPSAAAELVAKNADELANLIRRLERNLVGGLRTRFQRMAERVRTTQRLLIDPRRRIEDAILRCDDLVERLERSIFESIDRTQMLVEMTEERLETRLRRRLEAAKSKFVRVAAMLDGLSPLRVLDRGYALVTLENRALTDSSSAKPGDTLSIRLAKGEVEATVKNVKK